MPLAHPEENEDRLIALEARVKELEAAAQSRPPITQASAGLIFGIRATPEGSELGAWIYTEPGGDLHWISPEGNDYSLVPVVIPQGAAVANPANFTSGTIGGTPTAAQYNALRADAVEIRAQVIALLTSLRTSPPVALIAT